MPFDIQLTADINIPGLKSQIHDIAAMAIEKVAREEMLPLAVSLSPVDTGTNRASLTVEPNDSENADSVSISMFTTSGYGGYLEAGTRKMAPIPYIYPAYWIRKRKFFERIKQLWKINK